MTVSVFDHPLLSKLLGDEEVAGFFSLEADMAAMLAFEKALSQAQAEEGLIPAEAGPAIAARLKAFEPDFADLAAGTLRDGMIVPALIAQLREAVGEPDARHVHFGSTSQDVIDTSLALRLVGVVAIFEARLEALDNKLAGLDKRFGTKPVMAHTRMQAALPVTVSRKISSWRDPLRRHRERLGALQSQIAILHCGGPTGTLHKWGDKAEAVKQNLARRLGLEAVDRPRHTERDGLADFASWLSLVAGSLGKIGQDIALSAQNEIAEIRIASGGGSSAMPHKVNPIGAETLVTLARFNATLVSGMHHALVSENERSGAMWTLEWMLLPQMIVATAAALRTALKLLDDITFEATVKGD